MTSLAVRFSNYADLTRQQTPVGWLLLLFPTLASLVVSAPGWPDAKTVAVFTLGVWLTRSAGCVINDIADIKFDALVVRTKRRPLAEARISKTEALALFACLMALSASLLLLLTPAAALTAVLAVPLIIAYPFAKRVTNAPQLVLGVAFSWGILVASVEVSGGISQAALILFAANFLWILAYDTFYALQDLPDDQAIGVGSLATRYGIDGALRLVKLCQAGVIACLALLGVTLAFPWHYYLCLPAVLALFAYQHLALGKEANRQSLGYLRAFKHNAVVGAVMLLAVITGQAAL